MIEDAVSQLRAKLSGADAPNSPQESFETRLTLACLRGKGHLLVTGPDRSAIDQLLARVIEKVEPMAVVKARASDPATGIDQVFALVANGSMPKGHGERQRALAELVQRAEAADKTVLVVVDDAEAATVEQLEHMRESLEVGPDTPKYLRLVLVGHGGLLAKLNSQTGRPLSARIASHVSLDEPDAHSESGAAPTPSRVEVKDSSRSYALTLTAATCVAFSIIVYLTAFLSSPQRGGHGRGDTAAANVNSRDFAIAVGAMGTDRSPTDPTVVNATAPFTPAFSIPAPKVAPKVLPKATAPSTKTAAAAPPVTAKPKAKAATTKKPTSISSFIKKFD